MSRQNVFLNSSDGELADKLWVDEKDAHEQRLKKLAEGEISTVESERLVQFIDKGYCVVDLELPDFVFDDFAKTIDNLWNYRLPSVLAASPGVNNGRPMPISEFDQEAPRFPGTRLVDSHSADPLLSWLYLHPMIHRTIETIYAAKPVATQSLLFEYGSTQSIHRDPWFVVTSPVANLTAVWIAMEDIDDASGPLTYVPGSHRLPHFQFSNGDLVFHDPVVTQEERNQVGAHMRENMKARGLEVSRFSAKRGQAFFWHSGLAHGGSHVDNPELTRRSFVVHFDKLADHARQGQTISYPTGERKPVYTDQLMEMGGNYGFEAPSRFAAPVASKLLGNSNS